MRCQIAYDIVALMRGYWLAFASKTSTDSSSRSSQQVEVAADAARRLLDAEAAADRDVGRQPDPLAELQGEAELLGQGDLVSRDWCPVSSCCRRP